MPCGGQVFQICCSAVKSSDFLHASRYLHARKRVLPKYTEDARLGGHCKSGIPGISKGPQPFCFRKSPEKTLLKGFLWATSSRRLDTALLCAAKKRGVEKEPAGRSLPESHWPYLATTGSKIITCRFPSFLEAGHLSHKTGTAYTPPGVWTRSAPNTAPRARNPADSSRQSWAFRKGSCR